MHLRDRTAFARRPRRGCTFGCPSAPDENPRCGAPWAGVRSAGQLALRCSPGSSSWAWGSIASAIVVAASRRASKAR